MLRRTQFSNFAPHTAKLFSAYPTSLFHQLVFLSKVMCLNTFLQMLNLFQIINIKVLSFHSIKTNLQEKNGAFVQCSQSYLAFAYTFASEATHFGGR